MIDNLIMSLRACIVDLSPDRPWGISISELQEEYSGRQRKALWGHAYKIIFTETGNKPDYLHDIFCASFFGSKIIDVLGNKKRIPIRTTTHDENGDRDKISTAEFVLFFDFVRAEVAEYDVVITDPNPRWREDMQKQIDKENKEREHD